MTDKHNHHHHHGHEHGPGHNHSHDHDHMHSHVHVDPLQEKRDRLQAMAAAFIEGFRNAEDKTAFLDLAGVPSNRKGADGLKMHLIDTRIESNWQLGTASPAFGSRELVYLPYTGAMVDGRETMIFTYVSLTERADLDLVELLAQRLGGADA